ncbi:MAG TPA: group II intron reverse transcriptase/maturase [Candidatus Limnocylindria bacterium]|nr:group II intron reverse transcriptase/maturase [Candidatus Limnocylindria bacterium]
MDKVFAPRTLAAAFARVRRNGGGAGVDRQTVETFAQRAEEHLGRLHEALQSGAYRPQAIKRVYIPKPGSREKRPLGIPTVRDRVVQTALRYVLEPVFERDFHPHSYGFRPGRGCKDARRRVEALLRAGYVHVVDADLKGYFDSIPHEPLMAQVRRKGADGKVLALVQAFLDQDILEGLEHWTPEEGTPQGAVISPLLANVYLDPLDHGMERAGYAMVRYADDFVVLCRTPKDAQAALEEIRAWCQAARLTRHPEKTRVVDATQPGGFDFLGYRFERGMKWPRRKSRKKLKDTWRAKTRRTHGCSLPDIIADVNRTLIGWFAYFQHSHRTTFESVDGWVRMRLRSLLRKRAGRRGRGRGRDHQRYPNAFFAAQGLFSLSAAHARACQSAQR